MISAVIKMIKLLRDRVLPPKRPAFQETPTTVQDLLSHRSIPRTAREYHVNPSCRLARPNTDIADPSSTSDHGTRASRFLTARQVGALVGLSARDVRRRLAEGRFPKAILTTKGWRIPREGVEAFMRVSGQKRGGLK